MYNIYLLNDNTYRVPIIGNIIGLPMNYELGTHNNETTQRC